MEVTSLAWQIFPGFHRLRLTARNFIKTGSCGLERLSEKLCHRSSKRNETTGNHARYGSGRDSGNDLSPFSSREGEKGWGQLNKVTMKKIFTLIFWITSSILSAQVTFNADDLDAIAKGERDASALHFQFKENGTSSGYDVKWYRCFWIIDPAMRQISGSVTVLFAPLQPGFDTLVLDLSQALRVDSVYYHDGHVLWDHSSDKVFIRFPDVIPQVADSVTVYYHGIPPENENGAFTQSLHDGIPVIYTLSEPYGASDWWPCKNGLADKADSVDIYIQTPSEYRSASNGILLSVTAEGSDKIFHWKHRYPVAAYLVCLAVTKYAEYIQEVPFGNDTLKVQNLIYPEDSASASSDLGIIIPQIQLYDTLFGIYPFQEEKYGHAQWGWGGGMEHQTMTFVNSFGFELLAHELAHQWYGDMVTCGTWTDIWLNEGFATYLSGLCYEHLAPEWWKTFRKVRIDKIVSKPDGSVYCDDTTSINRIFDARLSYAKGAMILHQLRWICGDSVFFAAMNNYLHDPAFAYGFARTEDFKSHFESSCGQDLTWYFDEWFTGQGYPSYQVGWTQSGDTVELIIYQTQSHSSVSFFELPVQLKFINATYDTLIRFDNTFSGQTFRTIIPFTVDSVRIDPDYQIISGGNTVGGFTDRDHSKFFKVFPNPTRDKLFVKFLIQQQEAEVELFDLTGRMVLSDQAIPHRDLVELNIGNLSGGLYILKVIMPGKRQVMEKVVIE